MNSTISPLILMVMVVSQLLFIASTTIIRWQLGKVGFSFKTFASLPYFSFEVIRFIATLLQIWIFTHVALGTAVAMLSGLSLILYPLIGWVAFKEKPDASLVISVLLVLAAIILLST